MLDFCPLASDLGIRGHPATEKGSAHRSNIFCVPGTVLDTYMLNHLILMTILKDRYFKLHNSGNKLGNVKRLAQGDWTWCFVYYTSIPQKIKRTM